MREDALIYSHEMDHNVKILTVSDSAADGRREDLAGPALAARLEDAGFTVIERRVVSDGIDVVASALKDMARGFHGALITTGGTGFSQRDLTPEATERVLDRDAPGLSEAMRLANPLGRLSRARAGTTERCLILNTPGSPKGALESVEAVLDVLAHVLDLLADPGAPHPPETGGSTATSS